LIAIGDTLFGSTVTRLFVGTGALNDSGQVAFYYELASGNMGIAVVPEPETDAMLLTSFAVIGAMARRRSCALLTRESSFRAPPLALPLSPELP